MKALLTLLLTIAAGYADNYHFGGSIISPRCNAAGTFYIDGNNYSQYLTATAYINGNVAYLYGIMNSRTRFTLITEDGTGIVRGHFRPARNGGVVTFVATGRDLYCRYKMRGSWLYTD